MIAYNLVVKTGGYNASGEYIPYSTGMALKSSLITMFVGLPVIAFIIGLLVAIFPYKKLPYSKKYLRGSLLSLIVLNGISALMMFILIGMTAAGTYPPKLGDPADPVTQEQGVQEFQAEIKALCDSSNYYFDFGLKALENGEAPESVSAKIRDKLLFFQRELDIKTRGFARVAVELGLSMEEYEKVFFEMQSYAEPLSEKYQRLETQGVDLK